MRPRNSQGAGGEFCGPGKEPRVTSIGSDFRRSGCVCEGRVAQPVSQLDGSNFVMAGDGTLGLKIMSWILQGSL